MKKSKVKVTKLDTKCDVAFMELEVGEWYDSNSCNGLCVKTGAKSFFSVATNRHVTLQPDHCARFEGLRWMCRRANVHIRFRRHAL